MAVSLLDRVLGARALLYHDGCYFMVCSRSARPQRRSSSSAGDAAVSLLLRNIFPAYSGEACLDVREAAGEQGGAARGLVGGERERSFTCGHRFAHAAVISAAHGNQMCGRPTT